MPMQPSPTAETSRLLFPSLRFCVAFSFQEMFLVAAPAQYVWPSFIIHDGIK